MGDSCLQLLKWGLLLFALVCLGLYAYSAPSASLSSDLSTGEEPLTVLFTYDCSDDVNISNLTDCSLDFGDTNSLSLSEFSGSIPHVYASSGNYDANLTAIDNNALSASDIVSITVNAASVNSAPTLTGLPDQEMDVNDSDGIPNAFDLDDYADDADVGDTLTFSIVEQSACTTVIDGNVSIDADNFIDIPIPLAAGNCDVNVQVDDGNLTASDVFTITVNDVNAVNEAPVASSVSIEPASPTVNQDLTCSFTYSDNESDAEGSHVYTWFIDGSMTVTGSSSTLDSNSTSEGDLVICQVTPVAAAGTTPGLDVNSSEVTIAAAGALPAPDVSSGSHPDSNVYYSDDTASFSWDSVSGASGYSYEINTSSDTTPDTSTDTQDTSYNAPARIDGTHYFHIRACASGECGATAHYKFQIDKTPPSVPSGITASETEDNTIIIDWDAPSDPSGIDYYKVYRSTVSDYNATSGSNQLATGVSNTLYEDSSVSSNTTYYYKVQAFDNAGNAGSISSSIASRIESGCNISIIIEVDGKTVFSKLGIGSHAFKARSTNGNMQLAKLNVKLP